MAEVYLPASLVVLFPGAPRHATVAAGTVQELLQALDARWPGLWDRVVEAGPAVREHVNVFVDGQKGQINTPLGPGSVVRIIPALSGG